MTYPVRKSHLNRRDFLKLALLSGTSVSLIPVLEACTRVQSVTTTAPTLTPSGTAVAVPTRTPTTTATQKISVDIDKFIDESARRLYLRDPEGITINGLSDLLDVGNDRLTDVSDKFIRETQRLQANILEQLKTYDKTSFTPDQALNAGIYEWYLDDLVRGLPFVYNDYLVTPIINSQPWLLQFLFNEAHPFTNTQDAEDYVSRLLQVDTKFEQILDGLKRRQESGVILPGFLIPYLLERLREYTVSAESHPFTSTFLTKTSKITGLSSASRQALLSRAKKAVTENVIPSYDSLVDYFEGLKKTAPDDIGVWRSTNGEEYYAHILRHYTTTELTADEIHRLGLENVERIQDEMNQVFGKLGYSSSNNLASKMNRLGEESGYVSGSQAVKAYEDAIELAIGMLDQAFDMKIQDKIQVIGGSQGNYFTAPPRDGSRPPLFWAITDYEQPKFRIKDTAFHEAVPGHGYQFDVARQSNPPLFRDAIQFDGYVEGWALYAERLMWELGAYEDDPAGNLGRLDLELLRAIRCVVDTGIHSKRWTFEQAVQYMTKASGKSNEGEIVRYSLWPAQATSYYVGYLKILELRKKAKEKLGSKFDLKKFHSVLLGSGQLPLAMLEKQVEAYDA